MSTATLTGTAASLVTALLSDDGLAFGAALAGAPGLPELPHLLDEAAHLAGQAMVHELRRQGLPGDHIDLDRAWQDSWGRLLLEVADRHDVSLTGTNEVFGWLENRLAGQPWVPAADPVFALAVTLWTVQAIVEPWPDGAWSVFLAGLALGVS